MLNKRDREVNGTHRLLKKHYPEDSLTYTLNKAPHLSSGKGISISHSNDYLALLIAQNSAAIDIEKISEKPKKVASKFLSKKEIEGLDSDENATLLWCAKECLFKLHQKGSVNFSTDLIIHEIDEYTIKSSIFNNEYILNYEKFNQYMIVYCFD